MRRTKIKKLPDAMATLPKLKRIIVSNSRLDVSAARALLGKRVKIDA